MVRMKRSAARRTPAEGTSEAAAAAKDVGASSAQPLADAEAIDVGSGETPPAVPEPTPIDPPAGIAAAGVWRPGPEASFELHWTRQDDDAFTVELRLLDAGATSGSEGQCVLRARLHAGRPALGFALRQAGAPRPHLSGCLERRSDGGGTLWVSALRCAGARAAIDCISAAR